MNPISGKRSLLPGLFILIQSVLYLLILVANDPWVMFSSIALCFIYSLLHFRTGDRFIATALGFTLIADFFLVLCGEQQWLWGVVFFLGAQTVYAVRLQHNRPNRTFLVLRFVLIAVAEVITVVILKENTDALAVISLCYYANLVVNIAEGLSQLSHSKLYPIGMILFLLCDTVVGLQAAAGGYLPIGHETLLYQILYPGFNLAWLFYLPSQVILALCSHLQNAKTKEESL